MRDRSKTLADAARDSLRELVRERLDRRPGGNLAARELRQVELRLALALDGTGADAERFSRDLVRTIDDLIDDAVQQAVAFRPGHAYCHRCESVDCQHSMPGSSRQVFVGYTPTGLPRWEDFAQQCLDRKHPQVDRLYDDPPALLALVQSGPELRRAMLAAFENPTYELLGQLVAGFFPVRASAVEGRAVLALTVQVAASRARSGRPRLGLNLLGITPAGEELESLWERQAELPWRKSIRWAQAALETVVPSSSTGRAARPTRDRLERRIEGILQGLARRLERDRRARSRRTLHAEQRHASGERPTRKAVDDARAAAADAFLIDERSGTLVVLGDRGRTHFFTPEGQHVSSVRYSRDAIARKVKKDLWRRAPAELAAAFRSRLGRPPTRGNA